MYRERPGALAPEALSEALTFADVAVMSLLDQQEEDRRGASSGRDGEMGAGADGRAHVLGNRFELY